MEIHVLLNTKTYYFREPSPRVDEDEKERTITTIGEGPSIARAQQKALLLVGDNWDRLVRDEGRAHPRHRRAFNLSFLYQPAEQLLKASITVRGGRSASCVQEVRDEGLNVFTTQ